MRKRYPSDISKEAFEEIRPLLESVRKQTKPRTVDLYEVFCGVLYLLKSGCQWRMLPSEFPKWRTVHAYFAKWIGAQLVRRFLHATSSPICTMAIRTRLKMQVFHLL